MRYVYLLQSSSHPRQTYVGSTNDLKRRLAEHNR
ncbi:MAG: GIY-YIG nuclease family protein, partial [Planctomycetota bacterium]